MGRVTALEQLTASLCEHFGCRVAPEFVTDPSRRRIERPDGWGLYIAPVRSQPRYEIHGSTHIRAPRPRDCWLPTERSKITVSRDAEPADVVKAIRRRLLPAYEVEHEAYVRALREARQRVRYQDRLVRDLAEAMEGEVHQGSHYYGSPEASIWGLDGDRGGARFAPSNDPRYGTEIKLHGVPEDLAMAIARTIADYRGAR